MKLLFNTDGKRLKDVFAVLKRKQRPINESDTDSALGYSAATMDRAISSSEHSQMLTTDAPPMMRQSLLKIEAVGDADSDALLQHIKPCNEPDDRPSPASKSAILNSALFENIECFLKMPVENVVPPEDVPKSPLTQLFDDILAETSKTDSKPSPDDCNSVPPEYLPFMGPKTVFDGGRIDGTVAISNTAMSYQEENRMLRHFFQKLLPLLDAHPRSPWPDLALRYCDFDVARSCFISLACIHIYESREGGNEYYKKGIAHIHSTMSHLIQSISSSSSSLATNSFSALTSSLSPTTTSSAQDADEPNSMHIRSFVIMVLVNVHILFAVLEKGKSSLARYLLKVFASLCHTLDFYESLKDHDSKLSLVSVLSWYDTVSAIVSPDCRLPYCSPEWYGTMNDDFSTLSMMGCPGEIFTAMLEVCFLRHEIHEGFMRDDGRFRSEFERVKRQVFNYRDYVNYASDQDYVLRLKGAQCWALAVWVSLLRLFRTEERQRAISAAVNEFVAVYGSMPSTSPTVTQMVWPVYAIGCECVTPQEREALHGYMLRLYETAQMGTLFSLRWIVEQVWERGISQEEVLEDWLEEKVDYLPL